MIDEAAAKHIKASVEMSLNCLRFLLMAHGPDVNLEAAFEAAQRGVFEDIDGLLAGKRAYLGHDEPTRKIRDTKFGLSENLFIWPESQA